MFDEEGVDIHVEYHTWEGAVAVYVIKRDGKDIWFLDEEASRADFTWMKLDEGACPLRPTFLIGKGRAVQLCGQLQKYGLVPDDAGDRRGEIAALSGHLRDMRALVAKGFDVGLK